MSAGPPPGHVQKPGTYWTPSDPQQLIGGSAAHQARAERIKALYTRTKTAAAPIINDQTTLFDYTPPATETGHRR